MLQKLYKMFFATNDTNEFNFLLQGENPIYKSAVTTVVNPKYEGK